MTVLVGLAFAATAAVASAATEVQARAGVAREVAQYLERDDFAGLERRYSAALASRERLPGGALVANRMLRSLETALQPPAVPSALDPVVARNSAEAFRQSVDARAARWVKSAPASSFAAIVQSEFLLEHGAMYQRSGAAGGLPADIERGNAYVERARSALERAAVAGKSDPGWYYQMLRIAQVQAWQPDRFAKLLQQALAADPYSYDTYLAASEFLLPQVGGSVEALESFARFSAMHTAAGEGASLYARIYWNAGDYLGAQLFRLTRADWRLMRQGFEDIVQRYPDAWNLNAFARFACDAGDKETARLVLGRIANQIEPQAWPSRVEADRCRQWAATAGAK